jgi:enediyne biosynthesis thioesterase
MRVYEYRHTIGFEETNVVGNVYYANHIRWQGRCREMFLRDNASSILNDIANGLSLVTTRVSCEYFSELFAFDEVVIRMRAGPVTQNRITMLFDYVRVKDNEDEELIARGEQQVACMHKEGDHVVPVPVPDALATALYAYRT